MDKTDDETDGDETDNVRPDTTDMPDLETEESAEKIKNQRGQAIKYLHQIKYLVDYQFL